MTQQLKLAMVAPMSGQRLKIGVTTASLSSSDCLVCCMMYDVDLMMDNSGVFGLYEIELASNSTPSVTYLTRYNSQKIPWRSAYRTIHFHVT